MKTQLFKWLRSDLGTPLNNYIIFLFRVALSFELIIVHGLKKIGIGVTVAEIVPNPFGFPYALNEFLAVSANLICPLFIIIGLGTRMACIPIIIVTLTGYFIVHSGDPLLERDIPFMYSMAFLLIAFTGGGHCSWDNIIYEKYRKNL
jgi:putative oxidoreductase